MICLDSYKYKTFSDLSGQATARRLIRLEICFTALKPYNVMSATMNKALTIIIKVANVTKTYMQTFVLT